MTTAMERLTAKLSPRRPTAAELQVMEEAAAHWRQLAKDERRRLEWDRYAHPLAIEARASTYEAAAKSIEMEAETGEPHCCCHLIPMTACRERAKRR